MPPNQVQSYSFIDRLQKIAYYVFLTTLVLAPIAFVPTRYVVLDLVKTIIIVIGTLISAILYGVIIFKEKRITAPPRALYIVSTLLCLSATISALLSIHAGKSFFGQGFEMGTAGFLLVLFLGAWVTYETLRRDNSRSVTVMGVLHIVFFFLFILQGSRILFGTSFLSLGILTNLTDTILGKWSELSIFALLIVIIDACALIFLPLTKRMKITYYVMGVLALFTAVGINHRLTWIAAMIALLAFAIARYINTRNPANHGFSKYVKPIPWISVILLVVAIILSWQGASIVGGTVAKSGTQYTELSLPWQMTLDVAAGSIKNYPLFGVGPNHFSQAFMTYKPAGFNTTDLWSVEFNNGFSLIATYITTMGGIGSILWILFFVFIGMAIVRSWKRLPIDPSARFFVAASATGTMFLWITCLLYVPSGAMLYITFVMTGLFASTLVANRIYEPMNVVPVRKICTKFLMPAALIIAIIISACGIVIYAKKTIAMGYFANGVKNITEKQDFEAADVAFHKALSYDVSDVYWQAISENDRLKVTQLVNNATSSSETLATIVVNTVNNGVTAARQAIAYDPSNYYNQVSEARISQLGISLKIKNAYDNAVRAYSDAIRINPLNPSLYVSLAQVYAGNNNLDLAQQALGAVLQIKNNYLDAIYLLSQVHAAKGNLSDAITAAQVAIQLNPQNPVLYFQLGLLEYNVKNYQTAAQAFAKAIQIQPDYANAKYFLGLSAARIGNVTVAIAMFNDLATSNPDNAEIAGILNNLRAGRSPFPDTTAGPALPAPEKRASLPLKEKKI